MSPTSVPIPVGLSEPPNLIGIRGSDSPCLQPPCDMMERQLHQSSLETLLENDRSNVVLVQGMRGSGKSATVATFAHNRPCHYKSVVAFSVNDMREEFRRIADRIIPEWFAAEKLSDNVIQRVYRELAVGGPVLMVFNNIEKLMDIEWLLPNKETLTKSKELHVIITTCNSSEPDWSSTNRNFEGSTFRIPLYSREEFWMYSTDRTSKAQEADIAKGASYPQRAVEPTEPELESFEREIGLLPIAVTAACNAILGEQRLLWPGQNFTLGDLLQRVVSYDTELSSEAAHNNSGSVEAVFFDKLRLMWIVTFENMSENSLPASVIQDPYAREARELLDVCSLIMPRELPLEFIQDAWPPDAQFPGGRCRHILQYLRDRQLVSVSVDRETRFVSVFPLLLKKVRDLKNTGRSPSLRRALIAMQKVGFEALREAVNGLVEDIIANLESVRFQDNDSQVSAFIQVLNDER